jgi:hypothetical protein
MKIRGWDIALGGGSNVIQCTQRFDDKIVAVREGHVEFVEVSYSKRYPVAKFYYNINNLPQLFAEHLSDVKKSTIKIKKVLTSLRKLAKLYYVRITL